ncbi:MAG: YggT family protein [Burkholderiaceae bacterium]|jgi:YggT family protein
MLAQIFNLLLQVGVGLVCSACLLRLYMQYHRVGLSARSGNPFGPFIFALSDWLVLPLRRIVAPVGRWDSASLVAAYLLELVKVVLLWLLAGAHGAAAQMPLAALFGLAGMALSALSGLVIVFALLSWVHAHSPMADIVDRLVSPLLAPIRRFIPLVGGVDLSPLALLVLLQIASIILQGLHFGAVG